MCESVNLNNQIPFNIVAGSVQIADLALTLRRG